MNIAIVAGVRPQFIKLAAIMAGIEHYNSVRGEIIQAITINAGQHYDHELTDLLFHELGLKFDYSIVHEKQDPIEILSRSILKMHDIFTFNRDIDYVMVLGDATTTMAAALAAARAGLPIIHVEAGVRSGDLSSFEEQHRRVVSHIATIHFCSNKSAIQNLNQEGINKNLFWVGDLSYDFFMSLAVAAEPGISNYKSDSYILLTLHKAINTRDISTVQTLLQTLGEYGRDIAFVTHPKTRKLLENSDIPKYPNIKYLDSLSYKEMIAAVKGCRFLITDSGGLQREALYLKKRCLVRRDTLGWSMLIDAGINCLIGTDEESILNGISWVETQLKLGEFNYVGEFVRHDAFLYAFDTLNELYREKK